MCSAGCAKFAGYGPLFVVEVVAATVLGVLDPALLLLGVPVVALNLMRVAPKLAYAGFRDRFDDAVSQSKRRYGEYC